MSSVSNGAVPAARYPRRNTDQTGEEPCQLLQLSAQLPHLLRTAAGVSDSRRPLLATLASDSSHQLARAYLLLYLLARGAGPAATVQTMYSLRLTAEHAQLLQAALEQLVTATYSQLLQLVPWVRIGRAALSHWQEVWRAWLQAMQDASCLTRLERCRNAAMAETGTAERLERYLAALPDGQQRAARDFLLGHGTLMGDRQRRAAADCANVTLLALNPRDERHREAFTDLRLGSDPPGWLEAADGADTVLAPAPVPAGALADWDRAEVARALGSDADPADGCRRLAEDCAEAAEARAAAGRLSVRLVHFTSLSELDEQLAELRFERVFTADTADRLGLFGVLEMAEVLLAPMPHAMIISSHSRWAALSSPAGTALSALRGSGSMAWDRQMDTEKFRLHTYLQGERLAYAARARHKDVLDASLRVPTVPEVTSFGTMLMTPFSRQLQVAVPHKFRPERRLVSNGDESMRFLEWRRDPEGVRKRLDEQRGQAQTAAAAAAAAAAAVTMTAAGDPSRPASHRGPGLYERHLQNPASDGSTTPVYGSIRRPGGSERRPNRPTESRPGPRPDRRQADGRRLQDNPEDVPDRRPDRTQSARRPRRAASAPLARAGSLPAAQRRRPDSRGFQPSAEMPLYEDPAAARAAARKAERDAAAREAAAREAAPRQPRPLSAQQAVPERPRSEAERLQRRPNRRRTIETGPVGRPAQPTQTEPFRRTASLRVGKNHTPMERLRAPTARDEEANMRAERSLANRSPATLPRSLEGMFPSLRSPLNPAENLYANTQATEEIYAVPRSGSRGSQREQIYAVPQDILRGRQQSSAGESGSPQFALSPGGTPYAVYGGQDRPRSPGTDSLSSQYDSPLSASHYSALQTPEGRRRLTNMFTFPPARSEGTSSVSSVASTSREASSTPPSLPAKRSAAARLRKTEPPPFSGAPLSLPRQPDETRRPHQPGRSYSNAAQTLPRQAYEAPQVRQPRRSVTLPRQSSEPFHPLQMEQRVDQRPRTYSGAPVPLPRRSADVQRKSEYDDYAVPQPRPRLGVASLSQQSASGSEETLVSSAAEEENTVGGSTPTNTTTTEPQEPGASPSDIDRLTQWREPKSIGDWLRQDRTNQSDFDRRAQQATSDPRWTRAELAPLPVTSSPPTRPGRITPTSSASSSASPSKSTAAEKRRTFKRHRETTEERLMRSLENEESSRLVKRPSSTDTATSDDHSPGSVSSPLQEVNRSGSTISSRRDFPRSRDARSPKGESRGDAILSTEELPHDGDEPQTIAELGMRDTAAAWVLEQCLQEVLSEERDTMRAQLIEWLDQTISTEMLFAKQALKEAKGASTGASTEGDQAAPEPTPAPRKPTSEHTTPKDLDAQVPISGRLDVAATEVTTPVTKGTKGATTKGNAEVDHLHSPGSNDVAPPKLNRNSFSPFDVNSEESGKLGSPRFPVIDTPAPRSIPREKFFAELFQFKAPTTGERLVTLRLDATTEAPPSPGEENPTKTPLFSSSVIIPSPDRSLTVPQRIVIDVVPEPQTIQPPAIRVPLQPVVESEVKTRVRPTTPPIETEVRPTTPPIETEVRLTTQPIETEVRPTTPPIETEVKTRVRPTTQPIETEVRPTTLPIKTEVRPTTLPIETEVRPTTPPIETEVKTRVRPTTTPIETDDGLSGKRPEEKQDESSADRKDGPASSDSADPVTVVAATPLTEKLVTPIHSPIREKIDLETAAMPLTRPHSPLASRHTVKPLSFLIPDNTGRVVIPPSGHYHRSPVEEPYPAEVNLRELRQRRAELEARASSRESSSNSTEQSSQSESSPEQPQPPSKLSDLGTPDPTGEPSQSATMSGLDSGRDSDPSPGEQLERDESESDHEETEDRSENENTSPIHRSSLHIPMKQPHEDPGDPSLQEILIKFPLVTLDSGEPQAGQPDVTITSPGRKVEAIPAEQTVTQTETDPTAVNPESVEERVEQTHDDRAKTPLAPPNSDVEQIQTSRSRDEAPASPDGRTTQLTQDEVMLTPSKSHSVEEADVSEDDHSTPPPLPRSPMPKPNMQPPFVMHGDVVTVETGTEEAKGGVTEAESDAAAAETGAVAAKGGEVTDSGEVSADIVAVNAEIGAVEAETGAVEAEIGAVEAETGAVESETGAVESEAGAVEAETGAVEAETGAVESETGAVDGETGAVEAETGAVESETGAVDAETGAVEAETGIVNTETGAVEAETGAVELESGKGKAVSDIQVPVPMETGDAAATKDGAEAADNGTGTKGDERTANGGAAAAKANTEAVESGTVALRRHSVSDKQSQRLGNLVRRRRSRKMSMDKEYHDMQRMLTLANAGLVPHHDTETGENRGQNRVNDAHPATAPAARTLEEATGTTEASPDTSRPPANVKSNGAKHPGSLAKTRRKSRPLSMDAEYYAMKSKLSVHNGHPKGHSSEHSCSDDTQRESAAAQPSDHTAGQSPAPPPAEQRSDPASSPVPASTIQATSPAPVGTSQTQKTPVSAGQSPTAPAARRPGSGKLSLDKEFFAMRAQLALHNDGRRGSASGRPAPVSTVPGFETEEPPSPPPSPVSGPSPVTPRRRRGSRNLTMAEEFFAIRAAHMARHPAQSETEEQSPPSSPKLQTRPLNEETSSPAPPNTSPRPSSASQTINLTPVQPATTTPAASNRRNLRPLPLDPELLASRAHAERPPAGPVPESPLTSPATPPPSPTSVLSRTGRPGSIRKRVQELDRSAAEGSTFPRSPEQQSAPAPFSRTGRPGSVRDKIRRMEMLAQQQDQPAAARTKAGEESPVMTRRHSSTHSPFTRLGSGGGGGVSSLTVRLQPSPPGAGQRASLSPSGPQPPTPVQRGVRQRRSLPAGLWSGSPNASEIPARKPTGGITEITEQQPENVNDASEVSSITESPVEGNKAESQSTPEAPQPSQVTPPKPAARRVQETPSPPDLLTWPWTAEDDAAEARQTEQAGQNPSDVRPVQSPPEQHKASSRSANSSPSAYDTANECSLSPRASFGESRPAEETAVPVPAVVRARAVIEDQGASSGTEIDAQDDDVFTDATGVTATVTATVTSL